MLLRRWQENDKNAEKSTQDLAGASTLFFVLHVNPCALSLLLAFRARLSLSEVRKTKHLRRRQLSPYSFPPPPLLAPDTQAKSTKHDMEPHPNNSLPTFKAECRT